jgi:dihydroflavonol-4-reductase
LRFAVTGATGFIGSHLIARLIHDGHQVTAVVRRPDAIPALSQMGVETVIGDVGDPASLSNAMNGADVVFHLARARAHGSLPRSAFIVNVNGSRNVARAARKSGVGRLVHGSSGAVYGSRPGLVSEVTPLRPDSAYSRSKVLAERCVIDECGTGAVIARITAVMGPGGKSWGPLVRSAAAGKLRLAGDGSNMHHPADVTDIVDGLMRCALADGIGGRTYNLAGPEPLPIRSLRDALAAAARTPGSSVSMHPRPYPWRLLDIYYRGGILSDRWLGLRPPLFESVSFITTHRVLDISRAREELGFVPSIGITEAAKRTVDWMRLEKLLD